jgi:WD40 repeat protein
MGYTCKTEDDIAHNHLIAKPKFIHTFKGHTRGVTSMMAVRTNTASGNTYVSASLDGTVRVWCLDKLISLYVFDINEGNSDARKDEKLSNIMMINAHTYALFYAGVENSVEIG